eukprot:587300-Amphidinium_carterae.1
MRLCDAPSASLVGSGQQGSTARTPAKYTMKHGAKIANMGGATMTMVTSLAVSVQPSFPKSSARESLSNKSSHHRVANG